MKFSINNLPLRRKIGIAVALISLLPIIVVFYYFSGIYISAISTVILIVVISLGWRVVFEVFSSITKLYRRSRTTLEDIGESAPFVPDEVQSLETMIAMLSEKVKSGFEQLRDFTKMTEDLNREVSRTVLILSTILQANDLFSKDAPAEEVIKFTTTHLKHLLRVEICFCILTEDSSEEYKSIVEMGLGEETLNNFIDQRAHEFVRLREKIVIDRYNKARGYSNWTQDLSSKNIAVAPIISKGKVIGIIGVGNNQENYSFNKDDLEVLNLFSQNITLVWEHERLSTKIEELEIADYLIGLYNEKLITQRLDEEIKRATIYQRPCGFITVELENYADYSKEFGQIEAEKALKKIAKTFKGTLRAIDIAGRIGPATLGAILIESNKRQSQEMANNLEKSLVKLHGGKIKLKFAVAESPINGVTAQELRQFVQGQ